MYIGVYLCNAIAVTEAFCHRYSTINNSAKKQYFSTKFGNQFSKLLGIRCMRFYSNSFRFGISIVQCLGGYLFPDTA